MANINIQTKKIFESIFKNKVEIKIKTTNKKKKNEKFTKTRK